jgi:rRNA maturation RNase YbeY
MSKLHSKSKVYLFFETRGFTLSNRTGLKTFIEKIFRKEGKRLKSLNYVFTTDEALRKINRDFLKHDYYTDIVSFDVSASNETEGEIYISIDRVKENARRLNVPFKIELLRVMFHGTLHLCGYKDKSAADIKSMRRKEDDYIKLYQSTL